MPSARAPPPSSAPHPRPMNIDNLRPSAVGSSGHDALGNSKSMPRQINTSLSSPPDTSFLDEDTPVEPKSRDRDADFDRARDSHDLSLSNITRDSVVDNMLLSLDQIQPASHFANYMAPSALYPSSYGQDPFFSPAHGTSSSSAPGPAAASSSRQPSATSRNRGHTQNSSSYSSDYDLHPDLPSSSLQNQPSHHTLRGRRSNSSSNHIQNGLHRVESLRNIGYKNPRGANESAQERGKSDCPKSTTHRRGGSKMSSNGSCSSSFDHGYNRQGSIAASRSGRMSRTGSFDHTVARNSPIKGANGVPLGATLSPQSTNSQIMYSDYEAAPTPTVPAGPRRYNQDPPMSPIMSPSMYSHNPFGPPPQPPPTRRNSMRSSVSRTSKKSKSQNTAHSQPPPQPRPSSPDAYMRAQANENYNASDLRDLPPVPSFADPAAPSPTVALRKFSVGSPNGASKERPGFFRRMFNSFGRDHTNTEAAMPEGQTSDSRPRSQTKSGHGSAPGTAQTTTTPSKPLPQAPQGQRAATSGSDGPRPQQSVQTLTKKHSSFFRRRKKSVSEEVAPPLPMQYQEEQTAQQSDDHSSFASPKPPEQLQKREHAHVSSDLTWAQPSPSISSLRKVMDPYLSSFGAFEDAAYNPELVKKQRQQRPDDEAAVDAAPSSGFSPSYKPHRDATIRAVEPGSRDPDGGNPVPRGEEVVGAPDTRDPTSPKLKLKVKRNRINNPVAQDDTFLADSSGNEDKATFSPDRGQSPTFGLPKTGNNRPSTSPVLPSTQTPKASSSPRISPRGGDKTLVMHPRSNGAAKQSPAEDGDGDVDDDLVFISNSSDTQGTVKSPVSSRLWLDPHSDDEDKYGSSSKLFLPIEGVRTSSKASPVTEHRSGSSLVSNPSRSASSLPVVQVEGSHLEEASAPGEPTLEDRDRAGKLFDGDEEFISKARASAWLGESTDVSRRTRKAYMELYDWTGLNILAALRDLCGRLHLKGETQQVDRVLDSFAKRWCECNSSHGFKSTDIVHAICYSILLLNTDLHVADIEQKMTRGQFVKNTTPTIRRLVAEAEADVAQEAARQPAPPPRGPMTWADPTSPDERPSPLTVDSEESIAFDTKRSRNRLSFRPPVRTDSDGYSTGTNPTPIDGSNVLVNSPVVGSGKSWELQIEVALKEFYNSIRQQRLPLHGAEPGLSHESSNNNLTVSSMLRRTPSVLSKAPSETLSYRGRQSDFRSMAPRWNSKTRSRPRLYPTSTIGSSRTSLDDQSFWSPAGSSTWSKSIGKTQASMMSVESFGSHFATGDFQQSIGFANALSQAIIREEGMPAGGGEDFGRTIPLLEDESLELAGAPWAKEGIVKHKHHLEAVEKKAKDRNWNECFAVIEKGYMRLFSFNSNSKSMRHKHRSRRPSNNGAVVGGGNWMDNAEDLGRFLLRHTIASALPPPGYSKTRPHVWALTLPTGAVHFFQVGTPDIVKEFVSTANYWAARLSKEPLVGGVSNMEYGWSEAVINTALLASHQQGPSSSHSHKHSLSGAMGPRPSMQSSIRSSFDQSTGVIRARLPGDKVILADWQPAAQSLMASNLLEVDQKKALERYVSSVEDELAKHQELRPAMQIAFSPRHPNCAKASANWERKSAYLLREIVKYKTYIDNLNQASMVKERIYEERVVDPIETDPQQDEMVPVDQQNALDAVRSGSCPA